MIFIIAVIMIIYFIGMAWTWQSLGFIEKNKKILIIIVGNIAMAMITMLTFQIAKSGIASEVEKLPSNIQQSVLEVLDSGLNNIQQLVQNLIIAIFTGVNAIIVMPQIAKIIDKINENQIEKNKLQKRIILLAIAFVICLIFETNYIKQTQASISKLYQQTVSPMSPKSHGVNGDEER
mgnify:CR=1 FL=1